MAMEIISHRGLWKSEEEKNTIIAFENSFKNGFGTETDLRDYRGKLVISHDIADENCISANQFFEIYKSYSIKSTLALNIKSDGLQKKLFDLLKKYEIENYFVFDMSIPDTLGYLKHNLSFYTRQSEYELTPSLYEESKGIWLDCFEKIWFKTELINNHISNTKTVAFVSPDLHKRAPHDFWLFLKENKFHESNKLILCTDLPFEAKSYFNSNIIL
jgi:hypothetical protein